MDWRHRLVLTFYNYLNYKAPVHTYEISTCRLWNINEWNKLYIDISDNVKKLYHENPNGIIFDIDDNYLLEIVYIYNTTEYRILYHSGCSFPPYVSHDKFSIKEKDIVDMQFIIDQDIEDQNIEDQNIEDLSCENMDDILRQLKGPKELFHQNTLFHASINQINWWIKRYFNY